MFQWQPPPQRSSGDPMCQDRHLRRRGPCGCHHQEHFGLRRRSGLASLVQRFLRGATAIFYTRSGDELNVVAKSLGEILGEVMNHFFGDWKWTSQFSYPLTQWIDPCRRSTRPRIRLVASCLARGLPRKWRRSLGDSRMNSWDFSQTT